MAQRAATRALAKHLQEAGYDAGRFERHRGDMVHGDLSDLDNASHCDPIPLFHGERMLGRLQFDERADTHRANVDVRLQP